jgi:hypothetical protein
MPYCLLAVIAIQVRAWYETTVDTGTRVQRLKAWTVLVDVIAATFMCAFG